jgi:hypothetical protein
MAAEVEDDEPDGDGVAPGDLEDSAVPAEVRANDQEDEGDEDMAAGDEDEELDEMMALFREAKVTSTTPAALSEAYEVVAASDLLDEARALRDLLRSGS